MNKLERQKELLILRNQIDRLAASHTIDDVSKHYMIFCVNYVSLDLMDEAKELLEGITEDYFKGEFFEDVYKSAQARVDDDSVHASYKEIIDVVILFMDYLDGVDYKLLDLVQTQFEKAKIEAWKKLQSTPNVTTVRVPLDAKN